MHAWSFSNSVLSEEDREEWSGKIIITSEQVKKKGSSRELFQNTVTLFTSISITVK